MKNTITKIACFAFVAAALLATPAVSRADDSTNAPAAAAPAHKHKMHGLPFKGKVASVDATAMTFTVGKMTIVVGSKTKITKDGKPGVFADITVGEHVTGSYKKAEDGTLNATSVHIGAGKKKKSDDATTTQQ